MVKKIHLSTSFSSHSMASQWTLRILLHSCSGGPDDWIPIIHRLNVPFRNEIRFAIPCAPLRKESHNLWKGEMNSWFEYGEDGESAEDCVTMDGKWKIHWMEFVLNSLCFVKSVNIVNWVSSSRDNIAMHSICSSSRGHVRRFCNNSCEFDWVGTSMSRGFRPKCPSSWCQDPQELMDQVERIHQLMQEEIAILPGAFAGPAFCFSCFVLVVDVWCRCSVESGLHEPIM